MNRIFVLSSLFSSATAFGNTCIDIEFDSDTNVLSARCLPRDNSAYLPTGLDLNRCFGYDGEELTVGDFCTVIGCADLMPSGRRGTIAKAVITAAYLKRPIRGSGITCTGSGAHAKARVRKKLFVLVCRRHDTNMTRGLFIDSIFRNSSCPRVRAQR
jgi:hypothetical protein